MMVIDRFQVGIDVGGTFTDLVAFDEETGQTLLVKVPSTPRDPSEGAYSAIKKLLHSHPADITSIVHASTVGSNLFLGQLGLDIPRGALVTTAGFRDVLEIGRQKRPELYNPFFERPKPLIDQSLRFTVNERVNFKGEVLKAVDEQVKGRFDEVIVYSFDSQSGDGLLDFLPNSATKQTALEYVAAEFGAKKEDVVFCGDSGNDVFPLTAGFSGVLVKNADEQLVASVKKAADANPDLRVYFAKGGFLGLNGFYTSGVIEGAYHYGIFHDTDEGLNDH